MAVSDQEQGNVESFAFCRREQSNLDLNIRCAMIDGQNTSSVRWIATCTKRIDRCEGSLTKRKRLWCRSWSPNSTPLDFLIDAAFVISLLICTHYVVGGNVLGITDRDLVSLLLLLRTNGWMDLSKEVNLLRFRSFWPDDDEINFLTKRCNAEKLFRFSHI